MADVVEVIHKINYEVNDVSLQRATAYISLQLNELTKLNKQLEIYGRELDNSLGAGQARVEELTRRIETLQQQLGKTSAATKTTLDKLFSGIAKGATDVEGRASSLVNTILNNLGTLGTKGASSIKNVSSAAAEVTRVAGGTASILGSVVNAGKTLFSSTNLWALAATVLTSLATEALGAKENIEDVSEAIDEAAGHRKRLGEMAAGEISNLLSLKQKIEDTNLSYDRRKQAIEQLRNLSPEYFKTLTDEQILVGKVGTAYEKAIRNMLAKAKLELFNEDMKKKLGELLTLKKTVDDLGRQQGVTIPTTKTGVPGFDRLDDTALDQDYLAADRKARNEVASDATGNANRPARQQAQPRLKQPDNDLSKAINLYNSALTQLVEILTDIESANREIKEEIPRPVAAYRKAAGELKDVQAMRQPGTDMNSAAVYNTSSPAIDAKPVDVPDFSTDKGPSKTEKKIFGKTADIQDPEARRRKEISQSIDAYKQLTQAAVDAYNIIADAQLRALDKEIEVRQKRVDAATKLAERGNTEVLRIEEERLNKAQKKREEIARKQMIVNAALALSNAIAGIAETATTGPAAIVLIPAVIAAIIAGYAAVSAVTKESTEQGFADGVVGYKGAGGPRDDKNRVWISSGESVITAAGTAKNRELLESINKGAQFSMLAPQLNPTYQMNAAVAGGYASRGEMHTLEKKMDTLIDAVSANGTTVHANVDERGLSLMTVKQIKRDQNRFR
jgi:hypothetical protein